MKKLFFLLVMALSVVALRAYDFSAVHEGQTLYYNILSETEVEVTSQLVNGGYTVKPTGALVIPGFVQNESDTYKVATIGSQAFYSCPGLTSVVIGSEVETIGEMAFYYCTGMLSLEMGNKVKHIGLMAFSSCSKITAVTLPESLVSIANNSFYGCSLLADIELLGPSVQGMTVYTFSGTAWHAGQPLGEIMYLGTIALGYNLPTEHDTSKSYRMTAIELKEGTTAIADEAFLSYGIAIKSGSSTMSTYNPFETVKYVTIPRSVTAIGKNAFNSCTKLPAVTIPEEVKMIGEKAFDQCAGLKIVTWLAEDCTLEAGVLPVKLEKLEFGKEVRAVPAFICYENTKITTVAIPHEVKTIGEKAFFGCTDLYQVAIGAGLTHIGDLAFYGCTDLSNITCYAETPPTATPYAFLDVPITATVKIPCGSIPLYEVAPEWAYFWTFTEIIVYTATGYSSNMDYGIVNVEQTCAEATFRAEAVMGCRFVAWNDGNTANPRTVSLSDHVELTAEFDTESTGIASVWDDGTDVFGTDQTLFIRNNDQSATIYDLTGRMIYQGFEREISLDKEGIYIVEIDGKRIKVKL